MKVKQLAKFLKEFTLKTHGSHYGLKTKHLCIRIAGLFERSFNVLHSFLFFLQNSNHIVYTIKNVKKKKKKDRRVISCSKLDKDIWFEMREL